MNINHFPNRIGYTLIISMIFLWTPLSFAECPDDQTYTGNQLLTTQVEVDAIAENPFTRLDGDLEITGPDIVNLDQLICLKHVNGNLLLHENPSMTSSDGLRHVREVEKNLHVFQNPQLTLLGFTDLVSVGGFLSVYNNTSLTTLDDLATLESAGAVSIFNLPELEKLTTWTKFTKALDGLYIGLNNKLIQLFFPVLEVIGKFLYVYENPALIKIQLHGINAVTDNGLMVISRNPLLESLEVPVLERLEGGLLYTENATLKDLNLHSVSRIGEILNISTNKYLRNVDLSGITEATPLDFRLFHNPLLESIRIGKVSELKSLFVARNDRLESLGLNAAINIASDMIIKRNGMLKTLDLGSLNTVGLHFIVEQHPNLNNFLLGNLTAVGDDIDSTPNDFTVRKNPLLKSCRFVEIAARLGLWGHNNFNWTPNEIDISNNDDAGLANEIIVQDQTMLDQFQGVKCVSGHIRLMSGEFQDVNEPLKNLEFLAGRLTLMESIFPEKIYLDKLRYIGDYIEILSSSGLRELIFPEVEFLSDIWVQTPDFLKVDLPKLKRINRNLVIYQNPDYNELAFDVLGTVGDAIMILLNPQLLQSDVNDLISQMTNVPSILVTCGNQGGPSC